MGHAVGVAAPHLVDPGQMQVGLRLLDLEPGDIVERVGATAAMAQGKEPGRVRAEGPVRPGEHLADVGGRVAGGQHVQAGGGQFVGERGQRPVVAGGGALVSGVDATAYGAGRLAHHTSPYLRYWTPKELVLAA